MQHIRKPSLWQHLEVFSDGDLLGWVKHYREVEMPKASRELRDAGGDYRRTRDMLSGLEAEAIKRGLL